MTLRRIHPLLLLPVLMGMWALVGLVREAVSTTPETWRLAFHGIALLIFAGLTAAMVASVRRRSRQDGGA